jgi:hypothetical protein
MGGGIFQLVMDYLSAAQCATAPGDIVFKSSCDCEIANFSRTNPTLYQSMIAPPPKHDCAIFDGAAKVASWSSERRGKWWQLLMMMI